MNAIAAEFDSYVRARTPALLRSAYLLTGDQHRAEDLVQDALVKTHQAWQRLRDSNPDAYTRKVMYHLNINWWRRLRGAEFITDKVPDLPSTWDTSEATADRLALRQALARLTPKQRAVIVLRYFEDLSEAEAAEILGVAVGTVKSQTAKALLSMRSEMNRMADEVRGAEFTERVMHRSQRSTVRNRVVGALSVIAVFGVLLTVFLASRPSATPTPPGITPSPSAPASPSPSPSPSSSPAATRSPVLTPPDFANATIYVPQFTGPARTICPAGDYRFRKGTVSLGNTNNLQQMAQPIVSGNLDGKPGDEYLLTIQCQAEGVYHEVLLALKPNGSKLTTLGAVSNGDLNNSLGGYTVSIVDGVVEIKFDDTTHRYAYRNGKFVRIS